MNIELKPIAESKVRQLGGDVCGVLVRKGDKVATVTDMGRVKWLSNSVLWPIANECTSEREAFEGAMAGEAHLKWIPEAGEYSSQITQKMWQTWRCARAGEDPDLQLIEQRDYWEEKATGLAEAVGEHFGFQVGEHSSANCPVQNAIDQLDELGGARAQSGQGAGVVAWGPKPSKPGRYVVRGFDSAGTEALVSVSEDDGEMVCNLHDSNSEPVERYSSLLSEISDTFEWLELYTHPQPAVPEEYRQALQDAYDIIVCDANSPKNYGSLCRIGHVLGQITTPTTPQADGCPECGSTDLNWHTQSSVTNGTPDGKLRANEVSTLFVLGCGHCSETIKTLTADQVAENMSLQPPVKGGE